MDTLDLDPRTVRRLAVRRQRLAGPRPGPGADGLREVLRDLRCLQLDPIGVVAPSHLLVLWSRVGRFDPADLESLRWRERWLFEYWAHAASMVLTEDLPLHRGWMRRYPRADSRLAEWTRANAELREHVLCRLAEAGPLPTDGFEDRAVVAWESTGWTAGRNVERMLDLLWTQGRIMVAGRRGRTRMWDLSDRCLPPWADRGEWDDAEIEERSVEHALRALGAGRARDVRRHFVRERHTDPAGVLARLESAGRVARARVAGFGDAEPWFVHVDVLPLVEEIAGEEWGGRTTVLSPFDNLLCDRERTALLWDFTYVNEMYTPRARRRYGYYVLPILHGDRLVGRIAARVDRRRGVLDLEGVYAEEHVVDDSAGAAIAEAVGDLAGFAGAGAVTCSGPVPKVWRAELAAAARV
ncbi:crosslink repair DNA glycosylase YcaQ family protein [Nocardiopsis sp. N85]|uniref:winged helix-turn-helix domain-containing protein n=1 Tax=Nocardiopsis sp. N85 TaxID=3029400 RepID=UPI00237EF221|nr:crosslink repair DNA glycosylase YcaQ family protein [Nocardiopsis sp. N85]MDE3720417.1 crosslink repair DNA glycosylase YcaQ family protein [Nocardiopsis sp. N85]